MHSLRGTRATDTKLTRSSDSTVLSDQTRTFDAVGNVATLGTTLPTGTDNQAFCYDEQNRLTWASSASGSPPCGGALTAGTLTSAQYGPSSFTFDTLDRLTGAGGNSYTYGESAHLHAATGLDYYNARYYDASAGQFASADTAQDGLNRYGYVHGNPTTASDPSGHLACQMTCDGGGSCDCSTPTPTPTSPPGGGDYSVTIPHPCGGSWTEKQCGEAHSARLGSAITWKAIAHFIEAGLGVFNLVVDFGQLMKDLKSSDPLSAIGDALSVMGDAFVVISAILSAAAALGNDVGFIQKWVDTLAGAFSVLAGLYHAFILATGFFIEAAKILLMAGIEAGQAAFAGQGLVLALIFAIVGAAMLKDGWRNAQRCWKSLVPRGSFRGIRRRRVP